MLSKARTVLIGYTGFVGGNIATQATFTDYYNSKNIGKIKGKTYDLIVSAGTRAERWKANQSPDEDWYSIKRLLNNLEKTKANKLILISTVDVYPNPNGVDEDTIIDQLQLTQAYGCHRYKMEQFMKSHFSKVTIIRCPQLYGLGLKKNFVFDLIHESSLDFTHKDTTLQFYHLKNIWDDIQVAVNNSLPLVNFAVEPVTAAELASYSLNINFANVTKKPAMQFDMQTKYADLYGLPGRYLYNKTRTLKELKEFILEERARIGK